MTALALGPLTPERTPDWSQRRLVNEGTKGSQPSWPPDPHVSATIRCTSRSLLMPDKPIPRYGNAARTEPSSSTTGSPSAVPTPEPAAGTPDSYPLPILYFCIRRTALPHTQKQQHQRQQSPTTNNRHNQQPSSTSTTSTTTITTTPPYPPLPHPHSPSLLHPHSRTLTYTLHPRPNLTFPPPYRPSTFPSCSRPRLTRDPPLTILRLPAKAPNLTPPPRRAPPRPVQSGQDPPSLTRPRATGNAAVAACIAARNGKRNECALHCARGGRRRVVSPHSFEHPRRHPVFPPSVIRRTSPRTSERRASALAPARPARTPQGYAQSAPADTRHTAAYSRIPPFDARRPRT